MTNRFPNDDSFTFSNGYYCWVTAIFVDIRNSSALFGDEDKEKVAKVIKSFTSETIEILRNNDNLREIGIRGDCVYAIYTSPMKRDEYELAEKTFYINTFMKMLNELLLGRNLPEIKIGIGMSTSKELVIKADRKDVGINSKVWIGKAVARASKFSSFGNKNGIAPLIFSKSSYDQFISFLEEKNRKSKPKEWFNKHYDEQLGTYYSANIIKTEFNSWILDGMKD